METCAFKKPNELREKVGNQDLCYLCTRQYKLMQHRNKKSMNGSHHSTTTKSDKKIKKYSPVIDISTNNANHSKKRSLDTLGNNDQQPNKRQKITSQPMCFHCKQSKKSLDEYKKSMEHKLSETNKRMEDYQRMAEKAKRKADQFRREKLNNVERIGELNGELEKERRKYHRDIQQKREQQEAENKRLLIELQRVQADLTESNKIRSKLEANTETLKKEKKEMEKSQKQINFKNAEVDKKIAKLEETLKKKEEKLNSKRQKLANWKTSYSDLDSRFVESESKLQSLQEQMEGER